MMKPVGMYPETIRFSLCLVLLLFALDSPVFSADKETSSVDNVDLLDHITSETSLKAVRALAAKAQSLPESSRKGQIMAYWASLEFLAGNYERSARLWLDSHSFTADDSFLLDAVHALILLGEMDAAQAQLDRLLSRGRDPHSLREAQLLQYQLALIDGQTEDKVLVPELRASLPQRMASVLYIEYHSKNKNPALLTRDYLGSPEYYLVTNNPSVSLFPHPLWFLRSKPE